MQTELSWNLNSLWPWANYYTFLPSIFLKTKTLRATLEFSETVMLPLTCQPLPCVFHLKHPSSQLFRDSYVALDLSLGTLASSKKAILPLQDRIRLMDHTGASWIPAFPVVSTGHISGNILFMCSPLNCKFFKSKGNFFYHGHPNTSEVIGTAKRILMKSFI